MGTVDKALDLGTKWGPSALLVVCSAVLVGFFVWRDWKREQLLLGRIETLETEIRTQLYPLIMESKTMLGRAVDVIERNSKIIEAWFLSGGK